MRKARSGRSEKFRFNGNRFLIGAIINENVDTDNPKNTESAGDKKLKYTHKGFGIYPERFFRLRFYGIFYLKARVATAVSMNSINLKYEAISVPQGSVRLVKKTQERKSSTCYLWITKGVTSSSPVPLKTRRVEERCTLNLSRAQMSSCLSGVVVKRGQLKYRPCLLTMVRNYEVRLQKPLCS
ncbi:hypothetical protein TNCV_4983941 [Trichonephila clavipes]|nr:hypothetical protein TNCV_4983941 [Trichonephila clavipes]